MYRAPTRYRPEKSTKDDSEVGDLYFRVRDGGGGGKGEGGGGRD